METIITIDLEEELTTKELKSFNKEAEKEGRTLEEHFKALFLNPN